MGAEAFVTGNLEGLTAQIAGHVRGTVETDVSMARHCTWRAGGPAALMFRPEDLEDIARFLAYLPREMPVAFVGLGSNLLVRDGGFPGALVATNQALTTIRREGDGRFVADAGVPCAKLAREAARDGYADAAFLAGIPGTVGGALALNAGAFGGETWPHVCSLQTIDRDGRIETSAPDAWEIGYRSVTGPAGRWFVRATFGFGPERDPDAERRIRDLLARRAASQPTGQASCGSVFRNPEGDHAGRLIEAAGLKGRRVGGAVVSDAHANFIINDGGASAADIETLMQLVVDEVAGRFGITLVPEVRVLGEPLAEAER